VPDNVREIWSQTVSYLKQRNIKGRVQVGAYLDYLTPENLSESELVVSTGNTFVKNRIEQQYYPDIKDAIFNVAGIDYGFRIVVSEQEGPSQTTYQQSLLRVTGIQSTDSSVKQIPTVAPHPTATFLSDSFNGQRTERSESMAGKPDLSPPLITSSVESFERGPVSIGNERTFDSFIVGDSNRYAFSAAVGVAKTPGTVYNPLFIYGESGLGKTHLLLAIKDYIHTHHPHLKTTYTQTSDFVSDFTGMLRKKEEKREFEKKYHEVDVILFDDVQILEGKIETTNEVFDIFNHFTIQNKQIILSADRAPYNIDLDVRYKSRFASGITIDIQPPTFETKQAIFENYFDYCCRKIERLDIKNIITREIVDRIIELSTDNIRELEGATASLVAYLSVRKNAVNTLTIEEVEQQISNVFMKSIKRIDVALIQREVESYYKISHEDLIGKKRSQGISYPRQVAMYLSRSMTGESFPDIGRAFGGKDHTTAMYAFNNIEKKRQLSKETNQEIEKLVSLLKK
jgi:chromosomal replication initiator protein